MPVPVRRVAGQPAANSCRPVDDFFYLQTNGCYDENAGLSGGEVKLYQAGSGTMSGLFDYTRYSCETSDFAPIYRYVSRIYYVNQSDQLVRLYFDDPEGVNASWGNHAEILVEVEDLQFEWFIDETGNGEYDRVENTLDHTDAANVVGAKIWLMVRNTRERPGHTDNTIYTMAGSGGASQMVWLPIQERYRRAW